MRDEHKKSTELEESELRHRSLVESSFDGYFLLDAASSKLIFINEGLCELFGYEQQEALQKSLWEIVDARDHVKLRARLKLHFAGKLSGRDRMRYRAVHKDGSIREVEVSNSVVTYQGKSAIQGVVHDLTDSLRLQRQLLQAQKMEAIGKLAGGIAHDFNNLLMGIQGTASLLLRELGPDHPQRQLAENIDRYAQNGTNLTRQLLGFASGDGFQKHGMDLGGLLKSSAEMLGRTKKDVSIKVCCEPDLQPIFANCGQIEQALLNLYLNAWQAMPGGGVLEIHAENATLSQPFGKLAVGSYVRVTIRDTGLGMEADVLDRIFDPFFTTKELGCGVGLGLASVYTIVQGHGGSIEVESFPGSGTTFTMLL
ncbi:MAG: PAS domain S-box protein, partial [Deltaproteobacteria bacterium]|nr:PAS domain S-box protein [Deltaproteobacteria bacterium]